MTETLDQALADLKAAEQKVEQLTHPTPEPTPTPEPQPSTATEEKDAELARLERDLGAAPNNEQIRQRINARLAELARGKP